MQKNHHEVVDFKQKEVRTRWANQAEWLERRRKIGPIGIAMRKALVKAG